MEGTVPRDGGRGAGPGGSGRGVGSRGGRAKEGRDEGVGPDQAVTLTDLPLALTPRQQVSSSKRATT